MFENGFIPENPGTRAAVSAGFPTSALSTFGIEQVFVVGRAVPRMAGCSEAFQAPTHETPGAPSSQV